MKIIAEKMAKTRELFTVAFMLLLFLITGLINPSFLAGDNLLLCFNGSVIYILLAIGVSFVITTGDIDVSVGATMGFTAAVCATLIRDGSSLMTAVVSAVAIGAVIGLINGLGVTKLRIPAIIMTLGINGVVRGSIYVYTQGKWVENLPAVFKSYGQISLFGFVNLFLLGTVLIVVGTYLYLHRARKGKYFAAIGDNIGGATLIGIPVDRVRITAFVLSGVFAAIAGVVFASKVGFVTPTAGNGYEMKAIAACVLGGVSLTGGVGSVIGAMFGAVIMSSISRILVFLQFSSNWDDTITGILLIIIVVADALIQTHLKEKARKERLAARDLKAQSHFEEKEVLAG
ncbi:ABC transporter permease [Sinanaerobacter chloroacetimidivorans]|uniref:Autoinducer 2 import system permease protein LsrC n=1 Tax=Sinanaerobacter chloroacetimidivorans TaxID=2818044 RepID=A0A8J7W0S6_9FIRM|nr:ABC transporter permease [Sinanaerobacter chloroacetimidivorans]MBR0598707.1 ABC transporter permease [Sinanaerobacter chloroacetimidivorans]